MLKTPIEMTCKVCGKTFLARTGTALMCSDECRRAMQIKQNRARKARLRAERLSKPGRPPKEPTEKKVEKRKGDGMKQLTIDAIEARKKGMTYGKYIALFKS